MKQKLTLLILALCTTMGAWADVSDCFSTDYEHAVWLSLTNASNSSYVMFATSSTMGTRSKTSTNYAAWQQVAFVGTKSSFKIYSYCNGSTKALYAANSNSGTTVSWVDPASASTWTLEETYAEHATPGYGICLSGNTSMSLNMWGGGGGDCKFYTHGESNTGSRWTIAIASGLCVEDGKVYKISSYQNTPALYQIINSATAGEVINRGDVINTNQGYWVCSESGGTYTFASAMGDGKYLAWKGLSTTPKTFDLHFATASNTSQCVSLYSHNDDTGGGRYLYVHKTSGGTNLWNQNGSSAFGDGGSTDYKFEEVTGVSVYRVVSNINAGGVNYTPSYIGTATQTKNGFYVFSSAPSASDFTAVSVSNFTPGAITVDTTEKTITVNYSSTYSYTFTDINEQEYTGTITGEFGVTPTLTGCYGYTLSNEVWNEGSRTYTADITFPFPVSSNDVTNWTYINSFDAKKNYTISDGKWFYWHANSTNVIVHNCGEPTNESGKIDEYKWAIVPSITNGAITFTIKNAVANKYIYHDGSETYNSHTGIKLGDTGVSLTFVKDASATKYYWYIPSVEKYLSANSVDGGASQRLGAYSGVHDGESVGFYTPADFTTLLTNLKTARTTFNNYFLPWSQGKYSETVEGTMTTVYAQMDTDRNVVADTPTAYFTATQFKTYTDNYNNAIPGLRYVVPTFFRVKNLAGTKYIKEHATVDYNNYNQLLFSADGTDASSIFYLNASNNIISYYSGLYLFAINHTAGLNYQGYNLSNYKCTYEFLPGTAVNQVYVHAVTDPVGWGGDNKYWSATDTNIDRVATPTANSDFLIEEVTSLPVTITTAKYATLCVPVALEIPEGVKAYYISNVTTTEATLTKLTGTIPANMPVILYADEITATTTFDFPITTADAFVGTNKLSGQAAAQNVAAGVAYTLQTASNEDSTVGFYPKAAGTIAGFKAYLLAENVTAGVKGLTFLFDDDDADGITSVQALGSPEVNVFDLSGRRVNKPTKGLYIVNGKKVMVK